MKTKINYKNKMQFTKKLDYTIETQKVDNSTMDCDGPIPYPTFFTQFMLINTKENFPPYNFFFIFLHSQCQLQLHLHHPGIPERENENPICKFSHLDTYNQFPNQKLIRTIPFSQTIKTLSSATHNLMKDLPHLSLQRVQSPLYRFKNHRQFLHSLPNLPLLLLCDRKLS